MRTLTRFLNAMESRLWDSRDQAARDAGLVVTRQGRWRRTYRDPWLRLVNRS